MHKNWGKKLSSTKTHFSPRKDSKQKAYTDCLFQVDLNIRENSSSVRSVSFLHYFTFVQLSSYI